MYGIIVQMSIFGGERLFSLFALHKVEFMLPYAASYSSIL